MSADAQLPVRAGSALDRRGIERVLARAAELHATRSSGDSAEMMTEAQLLEIAREVGIDPVHVRQALAEERTRIAVTEEGGWMSRTFGPARVSAGRAITGMPTDLLATLDRWMQREECLSVQRRFPDRIIWEARADVWGMIRRGFGVGGRRYELAKASEVCATAVQLDGAPPRSLVTVEAALSERRARRLQASVVIAGLGVATSALLSVLGVTVVAIEAMPIAVGAALGWVTARGHRDLSARMQLALEQALDRLEFGDARAPRTLAGVLGAATRPLLR